MVSDNDYAGELGHRWTDLLTYRRIVDKGVSQQPIHLHSTARVINYTQNILNVFPRYDNRCVALLLLWAKTYLPITQDDDPSLRPLPRKQTI
jgi:hypothetical protein